MSSTMSGCSSTGNIAKVANFCRQPETQNAERGTWNVELFNLLPRYFFDRSPNAGIWYRDIQ